jgi:hypothetical protein
MIPELQPAADGSFTSIVQFGGRVEEDRNGFITALVVRAMIDPPECSLDYLESCECSAQPDAFCFWPATGRPGWAPLLPPDADDTAIIAVELYRHGRRSRDWLRRVALQVLLPYRTSASEEPDPPWLRPGVFQTWLARGRPNVVDCVVNVNVAALLAIAGLDHTSAYRSAVDMIDAALRWSEGLSFRAGLIAPFYADPAELTIALDHAVRQGAEALRPARELASTWFPAASHDSNRRVCRCAYGSTIWSAPVLQHARVARQPLAK